MTVNEAQDMPVHVKRVLREQHEIDAHVPMGVERLHIGRNWSAIRTRRPSFLKLIKDDERARLCPLVPIMQPAGVTFEGPRLVLVAPSPIRVDQLMIELETVNVREDATGMHDGSAIVIIDRDLLTDDRPEQLGNGVERFTRTGNARYQGNTHAGLAPRNLVEF